MRHSHADAKRADHRAADGARMREPVLGSDVGQTVQLGPPVVLVEDRAPPESNDDELLEIFTNDVKRISLYPGITAASDTINK